MGKSSEYDYLHKLGAKEIISWDEVYNGKVKALDKQLWAGCVDPVGGESLAAILGKILYNGSVAVSGLTGGRNVPTTVFHSSFKVLISLGLILSIVQWKYTNHFGSERATDFKPEVLDSIYKEISLEELAQTLPIILQGQARGRFIVKM